MIKFIELLIFLFLQQARTIWTCFHGCTEGLEIVDNAFKVISTFEKLSLPVVTASFIVEDRDYEISIDTFSAAGPVFKCSLCLCQINKGLLLLLAVDIFDGLIVEVNDCFDVFIWGMIKRITFAVCQFQKFVCREMNGMLQL
jgi:hypothetical protein